MPGRKYTGASGYRYGFNGKENDNEVKGDGNTVAFENRIYDSRLGKWFSVDPLQKKYAGFSPYNFVENNPIVYIDKDGRDKWLNIIITDERTGKTTQLSILISHEVKAGEEELVNSFGNLYWYSWDDINLNYNITVDKDGKVNTTFTEERGKTQTRTMGKNTLKAKFNIWYNNLSQKEADIGEGYLLSKELKEGDKRVGGDPLAPGAEKIGIIDNADDLLALLGGADFNITSIRSVTNPNTPWQEKILAFMEALKQAKAGGEQTGDLVDKLIQEIKEAKNNENTPDKTETGEKNPQDSIKPGTIYYSRSLKDNMRKNSDGTSTCCQTEKATDTIPKRNP